MRLPPSHDLSTQLEQPGISQRSAAPIVCGAGYAVSFHLRSPRCEGSGAPENEEAWRSLPGGRRAARHAGEACGLPGEGGFASRRSTGGDFKSPGPRLPDVGTGAFGNPPGRLSPPLGRAQCSHRRQTLGAGPAGCPGPPECVLARHARGRRTTGARVARTGPDRVSATSPARRRSAAPLRERL